jgi:hypothetical protein
VLASATDVEQGQRGMPGMQSHWGSTGGQRPVLRTTEPTAGPDAGTEELVCQWRASGG